MGYYKETFPRWFADLTLALDRAERCENLLAQVDGALLDIGRESNMLLYGTTAAGYQRGDIDAARYTVHLIVELLRTVKTRTQVDRRTD